MKYHDHSAYVSDVRKRLPQLLKLDGVYVSPLIMADLIEDGLDLSQLSICDIREDSKEASFMWNSFCLEQGLSFPAALLSVLRNARHDTHNVARRAST
jgi:hypothetical protein